ncbi:MAG: DUF5696 domain-containing protein [Candidatus Bathyarchaeia archaeon]
MREGALSILDSPFIRLEFFEDGSYRILDKQTQVVWRSNPYIKRFGSASLCVDGGTLNVSFNNFDLVESDGRNIRMVYRLKDVGAEIRFNIGLLDDDRSLEFSYETRGKISVDSLRLLDDGFWITDADRGYMVIPVREGLIVRSDSGIPFIHRFGTFDYEGCHMEMLGLVKDKSAVLVTWHEPYVAAEIKSTLNEGVTDARQILSLSMYLRKTARSLRISFLGEGDYVSIAKAYRKIVQEKGWLATLREKAERNPEVVKLLGASNFKLWSCLTRLMDYKMWEELVQVNWTFNEAAEVAEHLRRDLGIEKALFIIGGWIRRGYDNQHPDILPAAPECGGNEGLAKASRRVRDLGYLFCLHDNYQDIYRDSPSWSEDLIMKGPDGQLVKGGFWAGGQAWLVCSKMGLEMAKRNMPEVKALFNPNAYFVDTTTASPLFECYDEKHPLTKWDDMEYKQRLLEYTASVFGISGSECGREWAVPYSHFFEGLVGVSGRYYHALNPESISAKVIPLFEMVYRDCVAAYGKYGYDPSEAAEYVLHHIVMGRPLHYHFFDQFGRGTYWKNAPKDEPRGHPFSSSCFIRADGGWAEGLCMLDRFIKNTHEILSPLYEITAEKPVTKHEFLTSDFSVERVVFGEDVEVVVNKALGFVRWGAKYKDYVYNSKMGGEVVLPTFGFVIESPTFIAFHAMKWDGIEYREPALFTVRSLDGKPISESGKIRVFHGFGDQRIKIRRKVHVVPKEEILYF